MQVMSSRFPGVKYWAEVQQSMQLSLSEPFPTISSDLRIWEWKNGHGSMYCPTLKNWKNPTERMNNGTDIRATSRLTRFIRQISRLCRSHFWKRPRQKNTKRLPTLMRKSNMESARIPPTLSMVFG